MVIILTIWVLAGMHDVIISLVWCHCILIYSASLPSLGFGAVLVLVFVLLPLAMIITGEHYIEQFEYFRNRVGGVIRISNPDIIIFS